MDANARLARLLVEYSTRVEKGDIVIIETFDIPQRMVEETIIAVQRVGGLPIVWQKSWRTLRAVLNHATERQIGIIAETELEQLKAAAVYIGLRAYQNAAELSTLPKKQMNLFQRLWLGRVHYGYRVHKLRWCSSHWPTMAMAQDAGLSIRELENLYFSACLETDYVKLESTMKILSEQLNAGNLVHIEAPGTDICFSIQGIGTKICAGDRNLPDGEIFTAPILDSVNGAITFNTHSTYQGHSFAGVSLKFERGKIVSCSCLEGDQDKLISILDTDEGARFCGEFAFGTNKMIKSPTQNSMFDEKIAGSIHLTPGNSYAQAGNGNKSSIHWDLVLDLRAKKGGGRIQLDGSTISMDGSFTDDRLVFLNPE